MKREFFLVDVFGEHDFSGNPLAVVCEADDIDVATMQRIARWLNFSETTFLLPPTAPEADYRVRIFTLERELPFAGHPTLGSCCAWLAMGGVSKNHDLIVQECGAGLIPIRTEPRFAFRAPALVRSGPLEAARRAEVAAFLNLAPETLIDAQWVDNGPGWVAVLLPSAREVLAVEPARQLSKRMDVGVVGPHAAGNDTAFELRAFFTDHHGTVIEDPVTGSLNASVAQWLLASGRARAPYTAAQGTRLGRTGRIFIDADPQHVWVGGDTRVLFAGETRFG